jgi:hypothetical protein
VRRLFAHASSRDGQGSQLISDCGFCDIGRIPDDCHAIVSALVLLRFFIGLYSKHLNELVASLHAFVARIGADLAMLMHLGMLPAFIAALFADRFTRLELRPDQIGRETRLARDNGCGGGANICAIEIQRDASGEILNILFT